MHGLQDGLRVCLSLATIFLAWSLAAPAAAQSLEPSQPAARRLVDAPPGFRDACRRYQWFCNNRTSGVRPVGQADLLDLARKINRRVNLVVSQLTDPENYGVADRPAPTSRYSHRGEGRRSRHMPKMTPERPWCPIARLP